MWGNVGKKNGQDLIFNGCIEDYHYHSAYAPQVRLEALLQEKVMGVVG